VRPCADAGVAGTSQQVAAIIPPHTTRRIPTSLSRSRTVTHTAAQPPVGNRTCSLSDNAHVEESTGRQIRAVCTLVTATTLVGALMSACGGASGVTLTPLQQRGRDVVEQLHCATCHTTNGAKALGPTWKGAAGRSVTLNDNSVVVADAPYLRRSILEPAAQTVLGYPPGLMGTEVAPGSISEADADAIVAYLQTL
jgi:mono/diheme cytochrome c family protein